MATVNQLGPTVSMKIKTGETFTPGLRVKQHSDGTAMVAGLGDIGIGSVSQEYNSVRSDSSTIPVVLDRCTGTQRGIAASAMAAGAMVYGAASGKVDDTVAGSPIGILTPDSTASGSGSEVEFFPLANMIDALKDYTTGTALSNSTSETVLKALTIPANRLHTGVRIRYRFYVNVTSGNSTNTLTLKVRLGGLTGTLIATGSAVDVTDGGGDIGIVEGDIFITGTGASAGVRANGTQILGPAASATAKPTAVTAAAALTVDTTAALDLCVTGTWSAASGSNSCQAEQASADIIG